MSKQFHANYIVLLKHTMKERVHTNQKLFLNIYFINAGSSVKCNIDKGNFGAKFIILLPSPPREAFISNNLYCMLRVRILESLSRSSDTHSNPLSPRIKWNILQ